MALGNQGFIGRYNDQSIFNGYVQDVRLHPETRDANWWKAEHDNYCDPDFLVVGDEETSTAPLP